MIGEIFDTGILRKCNILATQSAWWLIKWYREFHSKGESGVDQ